MINIENSPSILEYYPPSSKFIGIVSIPHSGEELPDEFKEYLVSDSKLLMQDVDFRVDELINIKKLQESGIAVIKSNIIRTAIDLNRPKDLALLNWKKNSKGMDLVLKAPDIKTSTDLIEKYYSPYYEVLKTLILELQAKMTTASFIDLHSMPSIAEEYHLKINPGQERLRPDFCLSDIEGLSCEASFLEDIGKDLNKSYSKVNYNNPYFGGHVTRFLNSKYQSLNNIQIEICRGIYMDESNQSLLESKSKELKVILTNSIIKHFELFFDKYRVN